MDIIQRNIIRVRDGRRLVYEFKTYPAIFDPPIDFGPLVRRTFFEHLKKMFIGGMPGDRGTSPSGAKAIFVKWEEVEGGEIVRLAKEADWRGGRNRQHLIVQNYFLNHDWHTVATEVPFYDDEMEGCADIVRLPHGFLEILDFKPEVHKCVEKAMVQGFHYRRMASLQTGIPINYITFKAFDDKRCYQLTT